MAKGFNDLDQIQKQDNNKRIIFSVIAMLLITTVVIVILFVMKDSYDRRNTPSQTESEQSDLTSSTDSSTDGVSPLRILLLSSRTLLPIPPRRNLRILQVTTARISLSTAGW